MCPSPLCAAVALRPAQRCWGGHRCPERWGPPSLWCTASDQCTPWDPGAHSSDGNIKTFSSDGNNKTFRVMKANHAGAHSSDENNKTPTDWDWWKLNHAGAQSSDGNNKTFRLMEANRAEQSVFACVCMHPCCYRVKENWGHNYKVCTTTRSESTDSPLFAVSVQTSHHCVWEFRQ